MRVAQLISTLLIVSIISAPMSVSADGNAETFTLTGHVYDSDGQLAGSTSIKVDSMTSSWSEDGSYMFSGITPGEHTVRAYFMNNGHTVVYRKMVFNSNMELDWYEGMNWVTAEMFDTSGDPVDTSPNSTVELLETGEIHSLEDGRTEFGLLNIGNYYTIKSYYGDIDQSTQYIHFKMDAGIPNDFDFNHGMNSVYGFITDGFGVPVSGATVSNGSSSVFTNSDGFYLMQNLAVGSTQNISFHVEGVQILDSVTTSITTGENWLNQTSTVDVEFPHNVSFVTQMQTNTMSAMEIEWSGGDYTDYYSLYVGEVDEGNLVYRGFSESFTYTPTEAGTIEFNIVANNTNGSNENAQPLLIIVLPNSSGDELWSAGMSWNYSLLHTPEHHQNKTYTVIGTEVLTDAFDRERETYLLRVSDESYEEGEKAYRWVDSDNLLNVKTYWVDAPSSSSYYQEGQLGWNFTHSGQEVDLLSGDGPTSLHFNRTNIIGVPGHPNGYDDTINSITIEHDVELTIAAGTFVTTYISIFDNNDGVNSWELWYNSTVRNYVKIVDRLPGSHSDMVEYELTGYNLPTTPQLTTEEGNISVNDYSIEWAEFEGADAYQLLENGDLIYEGSSTSFEIENQSDGHFVYELYAIMDLGYLLKGDQVELNVFFIQTPPVVSTSTQSIEAGQLMELSWEPVEDVAWYSVTTEDSNGVITEVYNGTENMFVLDELESGLNRIRVQVGLNDGKISEKSPSIFITVEEIEESKLTSTDGFIVMIGLVTVYMIISANRGPE
ncbi:MAG: hypothetical protein CMB37_02890 [Euryarchaeota archaeon]|nr:hypothetical protein [Euryarchaeota archaeon]